jgi:mercuric ion transport protein
MSVAKLSKHLSLLGAVLAALGASSCCLLPLLLAALGLGGAGAFASLAPYRPFMLVATASFLGLGFYLSYRKPRTDGDACTTCDRPRAGKLPRVVLWAATFLAVLLAVSPSLLAKLSAPQQTTRTGSVDTVVVHVEGIDCEACAAPIRKVLAAAGGFDQLKLDVPAQSVTVSYQPGPQRPGVYVTAIETLGYEAKLVEVKK